MNLNNTYKIYCVLYHPTDVVILQQGNELRQRGYDAPLSATRRILLPLLLLKVKRDWIEQCMLLLHVLLMLVVGGIMYAQQQAFKK